MSGVALPRDGSRTVEEGVEAGGAGHLWLGVAAVELLLVLCLPRDAETARVARDVLDASLTTLGVVAEVRDDVILAVGEACANVIQHADPSDEYEVRIRLSGSRCVVEVVDTGRGFDAALLDQVQADQVATAEHGRGLQIIDALVDNLQITNRRQQGAMIRFEKPLTGAWGSDLAPARLRTDHDGGRPDGP